MLPGRRFGDAVAWGEIDADGADMGQDFFVLDEFRDRPELCIVLWGDMATSPAVALSERALPVR